MWESRVATSVNSSTVDVHIVSSSEDLAIRRWGAWIPAPRATCISLFRLKYGLRYSFWNTNTFQKNSTWHTVNIRNIGYTTGNFLTCAQSSNNKLLKGRTLMQVQAWCLSWNQSLQMLIIHPTWLRIWSRRFTCNIWNTSGDPYQHGIYTAAGASHS